MRHVWPDFLRVLPAQTRRATGEIRTPDEVRNGHYDLICIGSPTWWRTTNMPMRSFLKSDEARKLLAGRPFAVFVVCRRYWRENLETVRKLGEKKGGRVRRRHPFHVSGRPASLDAVADQLLGVGGVPRPVPGLAHSADQRQPEQMEQTRRVRFRPCGSVVRKETRRHRTAKTGSRCRVHSMCRPNPLPASKKSIARSATRTTGWPGSRRSAPAP